MMKKLINEFKSHHILSHHSTTTQHMISNAESDMRHVIEDVMHILRSEIVVNHRAVYNRCQPTYYL